MGLQNRTLIVFKYLWNNTDEDHTASLAEITKHLEDCGQTADPRTLRKDIDQLVELGVDIVKDRKIQNQYHVATRHFDAPEVKLLIDAVQSSRFITQKKSKALINKLAVFVAPNQKQTLKRQLYVDVRSKSGNESIYLTVDRIQTAITEKKRIVFQYYEYTPEKERVFRRDGQVYSVSPYALLWNNDAYYVVGYHDLRGIVAKFRADRIANLEISDKQIVQKPKDFDVSEFFSQEFFMRDGKECRVDLLCDNVLMTSIIDRFGEAVHTEVVDDRHFKVTATVDLSNTFYGWVFASAGKMKILSPDEAVGGFSTLLDSFK